MAVLLDSDNNSDSESNPLPDFSCVFDVASSKSSDRHGCLQNSREKAINLTKRKRNMVRTCYYYICQMIYLSNFSGYLTHCIYFMHNSMFRVTYCICVNVMLVYCR